MKIWWCQEHEVSGMFGSVLPTYCVSKHCWPDGYPTPCRLVPMRLIPDNAVNRFEVIDGTNNGEGRILSKWENFKFNVGFDLQDGGRTLKIFLTNLDGERP